MLACHGGSIYVAIFYGMVGWANRIFEFGGKEASVDFFSSQE